MRGFTQSTLHRQWSFGTRVRDLIPECYLSGMVHSRILCHGLHDNKQMCLKFQPCDAGATYDTNNVYTYAVS